MLNEISKYCQHLLRALALVQTAFCQDSIKSNKKSIIGLPVVYYSPETRLAFGGFASYTYKGKNDTLQKFSSQIQLGAVYTFNKQLFFFLPFRLYSNNSRFLVYGEAGYYKYSYYFYGIGNNQPNEYRELYKINFQRLRLNLMKKVNSKMYAGIRYWFENSRMIETESGKQLSSGEITGSKSGIISGLGVALNYDTRDSIFYPGKGLFIDAGVQLNGSFIGSSFTFARYTVDASAYFKISPKSIIACNMVSDVVQGKAPFTYLALLGGSSKMRGFYEGKYRDNMLMAAGAEYRYSIFNRFAVVTFLNIGAVGKQINDATSNLRTSFGAGLRFNIVPKEHLNLRFDMAFGKQTNAFYFTIGEAF